MTRHQRRKASKATRSAACLASQEAAYRAVIAAVVRDNLSNPRRGPRSSCPISSVYTGMTAARANGHGVGYSK